MVCCWFFHFFLCLECDFEESHLCGYSNQWNANVNWYVGGGGAQLLHNNIPNDHTYNNKTGEYYWYNGVFTAAAHTVYVFLKMKEHVTKCNSVAQWCVFKFLDNGALWHRGRIYCMSGFGPKNILVSIGSIHGWLWSCCGIYGTIKKHIEYHQIYHFNVKFRESDFVI